MSMCHLLRLHLLRALCAAAISVMTSAAAEARYSFFPGLAGGSVSGAIFDRSPSAAYAYGPMYPYGYQPKTCGDIYSLPVYRPRYFHRYPYRTYSHRPPRRSYAYAPASKGSYTRYLPNIRGSGSRMYSHGIGIRSEFNPSAVSPGSPRSIPRL